MEQITLDVQSREQSGTGAARQLRRDKKVPGVVYGLDKETVNLAVDYQALIDIIDHAAGSNILIELHIDGEAPSDKMAALLKSVDYSPVEKEPLNVDFQWVSLTEMITVDVPIITEGESPGVTDEGGALNQIEYEATVECLPMEIPEEIYINIDGMEIGDTRYADTLQVPEGVELKMDPDDPIVSIAAPITEEDLEVRVDEFAELPEELLEGLEELTPEELEAEEAEALAEGEEALEGEEGEEAAEGEGEAAELPEEPE
ncbi:MAG: 50S ribosomal protein L25 [Armatimonadota bacterium]